jgi:hypothetical protein
MDTGEKKDAKVKRLSHFDMPQSVCLQHGGSSITNSYRGVLKL